MISLVIPTYRNPEYLDICLQSAIEGRTHDSEIIVAVDGYIKESQDVLDKYKDDIKVLDLVNNQGMQMALNLGVMNASNEHIMIINDDNVLCHGWDSIWADISDREVKTINQIIVDANADLITLKITANSFLQNMIRIIVGTLLDASKSKARLSHSILEILNSKDRAMSGKTVSPKGLYFLGAKYASLDIEYADINSFLNLIHG